MPNVTAYCYLSSLLFYALGYSKTLVIKNAVTEHVNTYDYTIDVSIATGYFVLTIFLVVIGSIVFYVKNNREQEIIEMNDIKLREKVERKSDDRRRVSGTDGNTGEGGRSESTFAAPFTTIYQNHSF